MLMKRLWIILGLLVAPTVFAADAVTVKLDEVLPMGTHTNILFGCKFTIHNATGSSLSTTHLFVAPPGLALKISDSDSNELKQVYANSHIYGAMDNHNIPPGDSKFNELYGIGGWRSSPFSLPEGVHIVRVRLEGTLSSSGYTNRLSSNLIEVHVP
jgi:hypothetical protein